MTILLKIFAFQKRSLILLLLEEIVDWAIFILSKACFIKANLGETWSSRTRTLFSSNLPVTWCKSACLVHSRNSDDSYLIGIGTQRMYHTGICWLKCRLEQTIDYVIVQTPDPFPQSFISRAVWNNQNFWMMNTQNLSTFQVFQLISHKCNSLLLQSCPKEFLWVFFDCMVNVLKGDLQSIKRYHVAKFQYKIRFRSLNIIAWKKIRDVLAS